MRLAPIRPRSTAPDDSRRASRGQSLVEFALVLGPLLLIFLAIVQFGFIFNAYVTMTNATREGARTGSIYVYDGSKSKVQNDEARNNTIRTAVLGSMNLLSKATPQFTSGPTTWTQSGLTFTNGDLVVAYEVPTGITDSDARTGQNVTVTATYHQDLIIPIIANLLPRDPGGRLRLSGQVTMVHN